MYAPKVYDPCGYGVLDREHRSTYPFLMTPAILTFLGSRCRTPPQEGCREPAEMEHVPPLGGPIRSRSRDHQHLRRLIHIRGRVVGCGRIHTCLGTCLNRVYWSRVVLAGTGPVECGVQQSHGDRHAEFRWKATGGFLEIIEAAPVTLDFESMFEIDTEEVAAWCEHVCSVFCPKVKPTV